MLDEEEVEAFMDSCPISLGRHRALIEPEEEEQEEEEEEEGEGEGKVTGVTVSPAGRVRAGHSCSRGSGVEPFALVFPSARRIADFLSFLFFTGPFVIWGVHSPAAIEDGSYKRQLRLWWRIDLSEFIPLFA